MEQYVIRGGTRGYERLQVLARIWLPTTSALFDRAGLGPGMRCLDLGCGGGDVTFELARRVGPAGPVTGVDMDEVKLDLARQAAAAGGFSNVEFRALDIYEWAEPDSYDLVYCRNVLQHLSRPVDVLRAMWAAVRSGGVIVVEDADFEGSFCDPPNEGFAFWVEAYQRVLKAHGGDPLSGRKLHRRFRDAGIPAPELTVVQRADVTGEAKTLPHSTVEATAEAIIQAGIASAGQLRAALASLADFAVDPGSVLRIAAHLPGVVEAYRELTGEPTCRAAAGSGARRRTGHVRRLRRPAGPAMPGPYAMSQPGVSAGALRVCAIRNVIPD